jgi:hypothetical protein
MTTAFPTAEAALTYRQSYDQRMKALYRKTVPTLRDIERDHLAERGIRRISGGPARKEELISAILEVEYPIARLNEATHVIYHRPGESSSACNWCHPHQGGRCDCDLKDAL